MDALDETEVQPDVAGHVLATATKLACLLLLSWVATRALITSSLAQVTVSGRGKNFVAPVTDAQGRKTVLKGEGFKPAGNGLVEITNLVAETFRGQQKDLIVRARACLFDPKASVAWSDGPLAIQKADQSFSVEGRTFRWQLGDSRVRSKLVISNDVQAMVRKGAFEK